MNFFLVSLVSDNVRNFEHHFLRTKIKIVKIAKKFLAI